MPHGEPVDVDGVKVWYFQSHSLRRVYYAPRAQQARFDTTSPSFDVVHTHAIYLWPLWTAAREARRAGVPYVVSPRGMLEKDLIEQQERDLESGVDRLHRAAQPRRRRGDSRDQPPRGGRGRGVRILAAARCARFRTASISIGAGGERVAGDCRRRSTSGPYVLFLGRINWKKGLDRLIAALPHAPGVRLVVAGNDEEGYQPALESHRARAAACAIA